MGIEDPEIVSFIAKMLGATIAIFFGFCFLVGAFAGEKLGIEPLKIPDKVDIGYIGSRPIIHSVGYDAEKEELRQLKYKLEKMRIQDQLKNLQRKNTERRRQKQCEQNPLMKECVEVMVSMGEKKQDAINKVNKYFKNYPDTKNVNDFILGVFKR